MEVCLGYRRKLGSTIEITVIMSQFMTTTQIPPPPLPSNPFPNYNHSIPPFPLPSAQPVYLLCLIFHKLYILYIKWNTLIYHPYHLKKYEISQPLNLPVTGSGRTWIAQIWGQFHQVYVNAGYIEITNTIRHYFTKLSDSTPKCKHRKYIWPRYIVTGSISAYRDTIKDSNIRMTAVFFSLPGNGRATRGEGGMERRSVRV